MDFRVSAQLAEGHSCCDLDTSTYIFHIRTSALLLLKARSLMKTNCSSPENPSPGCVSRTLNWGLLELLYLMKGFFPPIPGDIMALLRMWTLCQVVVVVILELNNKQYWTLVIVRNYVPSNFSTGTLLAPSNDLSCWTAAFWSLGALGSPLSKWHGADRFGGKMSGCVWLHSISRAIRQCSWHVSEVGNRTSGIFSHS